MGDDQRICIGEALDVRGGGFGVLADALRSPASLALARKLTSMGQGRVSGRAPDRRRVVRSEGPFCDPRSGDLTVVLAAVVDEPGNSYRVTLSVPGRAGGYRDEIVRSDAIGWIKKQGYGPVDGPPPSRAQLGRYYVSAAVGVDATTLVTRLAERLTFTR